MQSCVWPTPLSGCDGVRFLLWLLCQPGQEESKRKQNKNKDKGQFSVHGRQCPGDPAEWGTQGNDHDVHQGDDA